MSTLEGFKKFLLRGNVVDLAVGVVIGAAFNNVIKGLVDGFVTPLIGAVGGLPDFSQLHFTLNGNDFKYGAFINVVLQFLLTAAIVYFLIVTPVNALIARARREPPKDPTTKACPDCTSEIPIKARRCPNCTSWQPEADVSAQTAGQA
ncbi:large conductance mechanosensitive channel [Deinobacterium chartae]|uniref:Large-conductance mechanosensitive channel n=1 Tax=Deinobacterium chartae TaxID=521158 RepID=A0A841I0R0_9DEIO|nr:large conductance mechanosensitive channel [Deinobacterium chartae]